MIRALLTVMVLGLAACASSKVEPLPLATPVQGPVYWDALHESREMALLAQKSRGFMCAYQDSAFEGLKEGSALYLEKTQRELWGQNLLRWALALGLGALALFLVAVSFAELTPKRPHGPLERLALIFGLSGFAKSQRHKRGELAAAASEGARQLENALELSPPEHSITLREQSQWLRGLASEASTPKPLHPRFKVEPALESLLSFARQAREYRFALEQQALKPASPPLLALGYQPLDGDAEDEADALTFVAEEAELFLQQEDPSVSPPEVASELTETSELANAAEAPVSGAEMPQPAAQPAALSHTPPELKRFDYALAQVKPITPFDRLAEFMTALSFFAWAMWLGLGTLVLVVPVVLTVLTLTLWGFRLARAISFKTPAQSVMTLLLRSLAVGLLVVLLVLAPQGASLGLGRPLPLKPFDINPTLPWPNASPDFELPIELNLDVIRKHGPPTPDFGPEQPEEGPPVPEVGPEAPEVGPPEPMVGPAIPEVGPDTPQVGPPEPPIGPPAPPLAPPEDDTP